ncbi:MAG: TonB family protein [Pyrinomonadaceae bacterium]
MPLNVRMLCASALLAFSGLGLVSLAQTAPVSLSQPVNTPPVTAPTSGDVMRERVSRAKAFIAVRNYNAAIYELENIRRETSDATVHGVVNTLLMNSYLEQSDYKRAQDLLGEFYAAQKTTKPNASASYLAVASQIIKGARTRVERYRALGLSVSDRTLPLEATTDLEKMRETLELVITHSKEIGANKAKTSEAMMLLEEASSSRSMLARDDYDSRKWTAEVADTREKMTGSHSVVVSAIGDSGAPQPLAPPVITLPRAASTPAIIAISANIATPTPAPSQVTREREAKVNDQTAAAPLPDAPIIVPSASPSNSSVTPTVFPVSSSAGETAKASDGPLDVGSLVSFATNQAKPVYPAAARTMRTTGVVKVELTVSETGDVADIQKASGPVMLQAAAKDAVRKWKFKPFVRDGQPVRAMGFVNFNFSL